LLFLLSAAAVWSQAGIMPLREIHAGQRGIGKTVFSGDRIAEFQVEILGVLENMGPKQSIILARLSGGPLDSAGVMQGMSGSPVYIDGRLAGAVALAFPFAKEPIAGIRPIEDMLASGGAPVKRRIARISPLGGDFTAALAPAAGLNTGLNAEKPRLADIATPVSFHGFTARTLEQFEPQLHRLGMEPRQGVSSGGHIAPATNGGAALRPGDMITVQLMSGDLSVGADGTVTAIDGKRVYAFGHRFLSAGSTELPFARADVIAVLPDLSSSFKISSPKEWMGTITEDRSTAISGELGRRAAMASLAIGERSSRGTDTYHMQLVRDRVLSPFLFQMAVFSVLDATERNIGATSFTIHGECDFEGGAPPLRFDNVFSGDASVPLQASAALAAPLAYALNAGFDSLRPAKISLSIDAVEKHKVLRIAQVIPSGKVVRPGDSLDLAVLLSGDDGIEITKKVRYSVPVGAPAGTMQISVSDASMTNLLEFLQALATPPRSAGQVISLLNRLRPNTKAFVRFSRAEPSFDVEGSQLPDAPPSLALALTRNQSSPQLLLAKPSAIAEMDIDAGDFVVSGSKSISIEVKE